ncbi:dihydroorotase [Lapillicoccus jejuensis]|uniref:Dihydroorotase n=1 Tax=Lapillicoccus jejuensis TaxID=402171 RepID=A0A542E6H1_9MICO|nr:dihydroorotase [Lapillicoccus jejuensis]TQJ10930.1 dihydroorotase [Lapillicoccus jejuensis]
MSSTLVTGARPLGGEAADVLVRDGMIAAVGRVPAAERDGDTEVVDADGLVLLPGLVDLHTHLREPGREDAETVASGSAAAAVGGFTAVLAMANTSPVTDTAEAALRVLELGRSCGLVDVQPVGAVTKGIEGHELAELGLMARSRARVRVFSDDGHCVADARVMRRALEYVKAFGGVVSQHAQDPTLAGREACCDESELSGRLGLPGWPGIAEETIVSRDVMLARHTGSRVHVAHVSTAGTVEVVRWAKAQGIAVTAEVTPHHLLLTSDLLAGYDPVYKVNPPLRPAEDVEALRAALADGTIDAVATDHAPHARHDKEHAFVDAAFGMLGLETALPVVSEVMVRSGLLDWAGVARVMSSAPARIAGLDGHGQGLQVGSPANLVLVDPDRATTIDAAASVSLSRNNPYDGRTLTGAVVGTWLRGRRTASEGRPLLAEEAWA